MTASLPRTPLPPRRSWYRRIERHWSEGIGLRLPPLKVFPLASEITNRSGAIVPWSASDSRLEASTTWAGSPAASAWARVGSLPIMSVAA